MGTRIQRSFLLVLFSVLMSLACRSMAFTDVPVPNGDFEQGWNGWSADNGVWDVGTQTVGPEYCHGGTQCAATVLDGTYPGDTDSRLVSATIQLPVAGAGEEILLSFWQWFSYGAGDAGYVQISVFDEGSFTWSGWATLGSSVGAVNSPWSRRLNDLTSYAGEIVRIAFYHTARSDYPYGSSGYGWVVDDVEIVRKTPAFTGDFEVDGADWGGQGWADWGANNGVWQIGEQPIEAVPSCHGGTRCAGTNLSASYPGDTDSRLVSATMQLPFVAEGEVLSLSFWQWFSYGAGDSGRIQMSVWDSATATWSGWTTLGNVVGDVNSPWSRRLEDLTEYAGETVRLGFYHGARSDYPYGASGPGWFIDDIEIFVESPEFTGDFETGWDRWGANNGVWQIGSPSVVGPGACGGNQCAGTVLDNNYPGDTDSRLVSAPIQLPSTVDPFKEEPSLRYWQWFAYGAGDSGTVQISTWDVATGTWSGWTNLLTVSGVSTGWTSRKEALYTYAGEIVRIGFLHTARSDYPYGGGGAGWYLDNIRLPGVFLLPCEHDLDNDGDVDGSDLARFSGEFGRTNCSISNFCYVDTLGDGDVDGSDLAVFSQDFGSTSCFSDPPILIQ